MYICNLYLPCTEGKMLNVTLPIAFVTPNFDASLIGKPAARSIGDATPLQVLRYYCTEQFQHKYTYTTEFIVRSRSYLAKEKLLLSGRVRSIVRAKNEQQSGRFPLSFASAAGTLSLHVYYTGESDIVSISKFQFLVA